MLSPTSLPYKDTKPHGAADFYFCIHATFRFIQQRLGEDGLRRYWRDMGKRYYKPVSELWSKGGMPAVALYWRDFFAAEPGSVVDVQETADEVVLDVRECPMIKHLNSGQREIEPTLCQHCYFVSEEISANAGLTMRVEGGNGSCRQRFFIPNENTKPQDLAEIRLCS